MKKPLLYNILLIILLATTPLLGVDLYWDTSDEPGLQGGSGDWNGKNWNSSPDGTGKRQGWSDVCVANFTCQAVFSGADIKLKEGLRISVAKGIEVTLNSRLTGGRIRPDYAMTSTLWRLPFAGLYKDGEGTLVLTADNTYLGPTTVTCGILKLTKPTAIPGTEATLMPECGSVVAVSFPPDEKFLRRFTPNQAPAFVLALTQDCAKDIDLSVNPGIGAASLGAIGKLVYSGKLTPFDNIYRLGGAGGVLTMSRPLATVKTLFVGSYKSPGTVELAESSKINDTIIQDSTLKIGGEVVPAVPAGLCGELLSGSRIRLTWLDKSRDETGFAVMVSGDGKDFRELRRTDKDITEVIVEAPANAKTYYRVHSATNILSSPSNTVVMDTKPVKLIAPVLEESYGSYQWVDLKWKDNNDGEIGYVVEISTDGKIFKEVLRLPANKVRAHLYIPETRKNYFRIAALDPDGKPGPWSETVAETTDAKADVERDICERFALLGKERKFDPSLPASIPQYSDAEKEEQRRLGRELVKDINSKAASNTDYRIKSGVYRIPAGTIAFNGLDNFTVNASGTTYIIEGGKGAVFAFNGCKNSTLAGPLVVKQDTPRWSVARITTINPTQETVEAEVLPGYSLSILQKGNWYPFNNDGHQIYEFAYSQVDSLPNRKILIHTKPDPRYQVKGYLSIPASDIPSVIAFDGGNKSVNMTFRDIIGYGIGVGHGSTKGMTQYINFRILPQPGTSQLMCEQPGQYHMRNGDAVVFDGCEFNSGGDDGINLMSSSGVVARQDDSRTIYVNRMHNLKPGQTLRFYDYTDLLYLGEARVVTSEGIDDSKTENKAIINAGNLFMRTHGSRWHDKKAAVKVKLDRDVSNVTYSQVIDPEMGADEIIVRNCYWRDMHAQAILLQSARSGLIINNLFFRSTRSAINATMSQYWQEGAWPNNLIICNNVIRDNPSCQRTVNDAAIQLGVGNGRGAAVMDNIVIEGNKIYNSGYSGIKAGNLSNSSIIRNQIVQPGVIGVTDETAGITLSSGDNVSIKDNSIVLNGSPCKKDIFIGENVNRKTLTLSDNQVNPAINVKNNFTPGK